MMQIDLHGRRGELRGQALIDDDDAALVTGYDWYLGSHGYALSGRVGSMHRLILGLPKGDHREADHINGDRLDNRRSNLRIVTRAQQSQNVPTRSESGYRNVHYYARTGKWIVSVKTGGRGGQRHHGGYFDTPEQANIVAQRMRRELLPLAVDR